MLSMTSSKACPSHSASPLFLVGEVLFPDSGQVMHILRDRQHNLDAEALLHHKSAQMIAIVAANCTSIRPGAYVEGAHSCCPVL